MVLFVGWWVYLSVNEWLWLVLVIFLVILCEINNMIVENLFDMIIGFNFSFLVKKIKDIVVGVVVFVVVFVVLVGLVLFVFKVWNLIVSWLN